MKYFLSHITILSILLFHSLPSTAQVLVSDTIFDSFGIMSGFAEQGHTRAYRSENSLYLESSAHNDFKKITIPTGYAIKPYKTDQFLLLGFNSILIIDTLGTTLKEKRIATYAQYPSFNQIIQNKEENKFIIAAKEGLLALDNNLDTTWTIKIGSIYDLYAHDSVFYHLEDRNLNSYGQDSLKTFLHCRDWNGNLIWKKSYNTSIYYLDEFKFFNKAIYVAGRTYTHEIAAAKMIITIETNPPVLESESSAV